MRDILMKCDTRPKWKNIWTRIGSFDLKKSLTLGPHEALMEPVSNETSTIKNLTTILELYHTTKNT